MSTTAIPDYCYASLAEVDAAIDTLLAPVGVTAREYVARYQSWAFIHPSTGVVAWPYRTDGVPIVNAADFLARADEVEKVETSLPHMCQRLGEYARFVGAHEHAVFLDAAAFNAAMAPLLRARAALVLAIKRAEAAAVLSAHALAEARGRAEAAAAPPTRCAIGKMLANSRLR